MTMTDSILARLSIVQGDITHQKVDAIVNAANNSLLGGGGVDGAIHRTAGPKLLEECKKLNGCNTGEAKITKGYQLPASYVIHTVGPVWNDGHHQEEQLLASCYHKSFEVAQAHYCKTIAFPSISTGVYMFPVERASRIALQTIIEELRSRPEIGHITIVCYDNHTFQTYQSAVRELSEKNSC
jgi:O-acetyl-ADP-ribose deacetylase